MGVIMDETFYDLKNELFLCKMAYFLGLFVCLQKQHRQFETLDMLVSDISTVLTV